MRNTKQTAVTQVPAQEIEGEKLTVRKSHVRIAGSTRIRETVLERMGLKKQDRIVVEASGKSVVLHVFGDHLVGDGEIVLRHPAMTKLGVHEGESVTVMPYATSREVLRTSMHRVASRLRRPKAAPEGVPQRQ